MAPGVDVRLFGATGQGDDTAAIQAAIDAAGSAPVHLIPGATHYVGPLTLHDNSTLVGNGATLHRIGPAFSEAAGGTIHASDAANITVRDLTITTTSTPGRHLVFDRCADLRIIDVTVLNVVNIWATFFRDCDRVMIDRYRQNGGDSIGEDGLHFAGCQDVLINNSIIRSGDDCISLYHGVSSGNERPMRNVVISNCILRSVFARAITMIVHQNSQPISDVRISNIDARSGTNAPTVWVQDFTHAGHVSGISISGALLDASACNTAHMDGINITDAHNITLTDVQVHSPYRHGIHAMRVADLVMQSCNVHGPRGGSGFVLIDTNRSTLTACMASDYAFAGFSLGSPINGPARQVVLNSCRVAGDGGVPLLVHHPDTSYQTVGCYLAG